MNQQMKWETSYPGKSKGNQLTDLILDSNEPSRGIVYEDDMCWNKADSNMRRLEDTLKVLMMKTGFKSS